MVMKQLTLRIPLKDYENICKLAVKNRTDPTKQIRSMLKKACSAESYRAEEEQILANMQEALRLELQPQIERIVKISIKNTLSSTMNLLFTALFVQNLVEEHARPRMKFIIDEARKQSAYYIRHSKGPADTFLKKAMAEIEEAWQRNF